MPITSPRRNLRELRTIPLEFDDQKTLLLSKAVEQIQQRYRLLPLATSLTASLTSLEANLMILADATNVNPLEVHIPSAAERTGEPLVVKKTDSGTNVVVIDGYKSETIDGAATKTLSAGLTSMTLRSDGANWWIVSTA